MKTHTQTFKENLIKLGKEINAKITYTINGTTTELDGESLASVTPHFKGNILKSVMKQVDIVSDIDIPLETQINVQFGMKYDSGSYEYINFGNYIVYSSEKQEDTNNYKIIAYDKMLYSMKDYEELSITYPCTIKQFIIKLAQNMGLGASLPNNFVNQDRELTQDVFVGLGYTKRDVLDQLAEVTASTICISKDDKLEIRYIKEAIANLRRGD